VECGHPDVLQRVLTRRIESPEQMEYAARKAIVLGDTAMLEMLLAAAHRTGFLGLDISMLPEYPDRRVIAVLPMLLWRQVPKPTGRLRHRALIGLCMGIVSGNRASALLVCDCLHDRELFGISRARLHRAVQPYREDATAIVPLISLLLEVTGPIYDGALLSVCAEYGRLDVVRLLITRGASVQYEYNEPLRRAVKGGHAGVAAFLISQGAYPGHLSQLEQSKLDELLRATS